MANTKSTTTNTKPATKKDEIQKENEEKLSDVIAEDTKPTKLDLEKTTQSIKIPDDTVIDVKSNCFGQLLYKGRDGKTTWNKCGEVQSLTLKELREMKSTTPKFFESQWVVLLGVSSDSECKAKPADVYKSLGITKWYKSLVEPDNFKGICSWDNNTIASKVKLLSKGAKENLIIALNTFISKGILDSRKKIKAFEEALEVSLTEHD